MRATEPDTWTTTLSGAAAHARDYDDDGPTVSDLADLARADREAAERDLTDPWCTATLTDGVWVQGCRLRRSEHGDHQPDPWTLRRVGAA